jgi:hypothetical protein
VISVPGVGIAGGLLEAGPAARALINAARVRRNVRRFCIVGLLGVLCCGLRMVIFFVELANIYEASRDVKAGSYDFWMVRLGFERVAGGKAGFGWVFRGERVGWV